MKNTEERINRDAEVCKIFNITLASHYVSLIFYVHIGF